MNFTRYHSLDSILAYPHMKEYLSVFFSEKNLELFPKDKASLPLALVERLLVGPWDGTFSEVTNQLLDAVQTILDVTDNHTRRCVSLWNQGEDWTPEKEAEGGKSSVFLLTPEFEKHGEDRNHEGRGQKRPGVIICPGGGYERVCFSGEGNPVMNYMEAQGFVVFVLKYRTASDRYPTSQGIYPAPLKDLAVALLYVREHAEKYNVDAQNVTLMGFSAGGHLCGTLGCMYEETANMLSIELGRKIEPRLVRPDKLCLSYPVISFGEESHRGSFVALTGGDESMREPLSLEKRVTRDFPDTFLWACKDDASVPPSNAARMARALEIAGVRHELRLYPSGGHGCNLAFGNSAYPWTEEMLRFMRRKVIVQAVY